MREREELQKQREAAAKKSGRTVDEARASTTEPEARTMKFPDGGHRRDITSIRDRYRKRA